MKCFEEYYNNPKVKSYFNSLVGLTLTEAKKKLGYWWICVGNHINTERGLYFFERSAGGRIELRTENNIVVGENHNCYAMMYAQRDINGFSN